MKINWKTIAVIFIVLFVLENTLIGLVMYSVEVKDRKTMKCYYDICEDYPDAEYLDGVCFCYDYDVVGNPIITKTKVMD